MRITVLAFAWLSRLTRGFSITILATHASGSGLSPVPIDGLSLAAFSPFAPATSAAAATAPATSFT
jgi:hypothetical protein